MSNFTLADRGQSSPPSPIRALAALAQDAVDKGVNVMFMNIGQPDIETPREMVDAYHDWDEKVLAYAPSDGFRDYREQLAGYYNELLQPSGKSVDADDILVTVGGSEALLFTIAAVTDPGDSILVVEPFYTNYAGYANMLGIGVDAVTTTPDDDYHLDLTKVEAAITSTTRAMVIPSPGNPTGVVLSEEQLDGLAELCHKHGLFYISDEVYREFVYDVPEGTLAPSILSRPGTEELAIVIDSVSKRYSACGARIGCLVTRNKTLRQAALHFAQARLSPATVDQYAAMGALRTPKSYFRDVVKEYTARRNVLVEGLNAIGIACEKPKGAFYLAVALPVEDAEAFSEWMVEHFTLDNDTLCVAPLNGFYHTEGLGRNEIRMAYVLEQDKLKRCVQILEAALAEWADR
ncbi:MAG: aspartate aminotransferase [Phycisphaerae bacterium]|nr:aspartate aminotransferase [Phycisphaerae bacterium]|tara:strand:- start:2053 stop:3267 length:1215 start_codon:yes stop_codon:yes gene_type:complete